MIISTVIYAQEKNKFVTDEKSGKPMLIGLCDRTAFADSNFSWWFNSEYDNYTPDSAEVLKLSKVINDVKITIVMGTWCSDSRREVPRFFKILDKAGYNLQYLTLICVDRKKTTPTGEADKLDIKFVPTFIIYEDAEEINRIIETPKETLEKDLALIVVK
jgi:thiol-disulfide isomerase/thioredoxin